jgi:transcriptional regulator with XRE-family HTH domain
MIKSTFAAVLRDARKKHGLTARQAAKLCGVPEQRIYTAERGHLPNDDETAQICAGLSISVKIWATYAPAPKPPKQ